MADKGYFVIKNGEIVNSPSAKINGKFDVVIKDGKIIEIAENINTDDHKKAEVIDAKGCWVMPAFVDMHVHLREPGFEYKEDIESGTKAAVHGGYGTVVAMPNTSPVVDDVSVVDYIVNRAKKVGSCNVLTTASITKNLDGKELTEMGRLIDAGAVGFTDDGKPVSDPAIMRLAMQYSLNFDALIMSHCEELALSKGGTMNESYTSISLGLKGIPAAAEESMVARDIFLAETYGARLHICHVSTKRSLELIKKAKEDGVKVTCETAPHYFSANEEWVAQTGYDTNTKMNPPLRSKDDMEYVKKALADGTIDAIATDHAPHHPDEKFVEYDNALNGIIGLETAFSLGITNLVKEGTLSPNQLVDKMSYSPSKILGIDKGEILQGADADITIADPNSDVVYSIDTLHGKSCNSPFLDRPYFGKILHTFVGGIKRV